VARTLAHHDVHELGRAWARGTVGLACIPGPVTRAVLARIPSSASWEGREQPALADYVRDWLKRRDGPASDLDLVVLLVNSLDLLADPPDRLTDVAWFGAVLVDVGREISAARWERRTWPDFDSCASRYRRSFRQPRPAKRRRY